MNIEHIRNIGIFAPVDTGKTTLVEYILYYCNAIKTRGSVDKGTTVTDNLDIEKRRGISVRSVTTSLDYKNHIINIIDTPGHVDFVGQVERAMIGSDSAIMVLSLCDSIPAHGKLIFETLKKYNIPTIIFLNKNDRDIADLSRTINNLKNFVTENIILVHEDFLSNQIVSDVLYETIAEYNDNIAELFLSNKKLDYKTCINVLKELTINRSIYPVIYGSAATGESINILLEGIINLLPPPSSITSELLGIIFGIETDKKLGRVSHIRLFGGTLKNRDLLTINNKNYKVTQIRDISTNNDIGILKNGSIGKVFGLSDCVVGDVIGNSEYLPRKIKIGSMQEPLMSIEVGVKNDNDLTKLHTTISQLSAEEPILEPKWSNLTHMYHLKLVGKIQLEVLKELFINRFLLDLEYSPTKIIYKETISETVIGHVSYTMPKPCWAVLTFELSPLPQGSGVVYKCNISEQKIHSRYWKQIEQTIPLALSQGMFGWEVTDILIKLIDGEDHNEHTHPLDFALATPMGIMDGLNKADNILLEPVLDVKFILPYEFSGRIFSDIINMRGTYTSPKRLVEDIVIDAVIPAATSMEYYTKFLSITKGKGVMASKLKGYKPCDIAFGKICERRTVNPLDRSKYILAKRNALDFDI